MNVSMYLSMTPFNLNLHFIR